MGNRQAGQKQSEGRSKDDKKREKELRKEQEKQKKKHEKTRKKKSGGHLASGFDTDLDHSSHVTGGDSESSVFHSAENLSASPYLDSCTRSELEQGPSGAAGALGDGWRWGSTGPATSASFYQLHHHQRHQQQHHPMVLSSKDFRDGFSLEACIPPEIAIRDTSYLDETSSSSVRASYTADSRDRSGSSIRSKRSNTDSVKSKSSKSSSVNAVASHSSQHATPTSLKSRGGDDSASMTSSQTSAGGGVGTGYSTPLLSTPVFSRVERAHSPSSTLTRVHESYPWEFSGYAKQDNARNPQVQQQEQQHQSHHHPHFFNHQRSYRQHQQPRQQPYQQQPYQQQPYQQQQQHIQTQNIPQIQSPQQQKQQNQKEFLQHNMPTDFRNLPKPTSPHPQRRALSPKMTSAPFKLIPSDESSSSPTTPVLQRRTGNILDLFRTTSKTGKAVRKNKNEKGTNQANAEAIWKYGGKSDSSTNTNEYEMSDIKTKPIWKTWERSSTAKKSSDKQNKVSMIFATVMKTDKAKKNDKKEAGGKRIDKDDSVVCERRDIYREKKAGKCETKEDFGLGGGKGTTLSATRVSQQQDVSSINRNSSPPAVKSTAFCIIKLEELERSIEKTIREKFPDAEPFLLKKRSKDDELKGSRSLPTTPSLKKKLYVAQRVESGGGGGATASLSNPEACVIASSLRAVSSKLSESRERGTTRWCDETFVDITPSPAMSPVVLRRFGARTRHASISPKILRAKTAALYNSPNEMSRVARSPTGSRTVITKVPVYCAISRDQTKSPARLPLITTSSPSASTPCPKPLSYKSTSKYDNVNDESDGESAQSLPRDCGHSVSSFHLIKQKCVDDSGEIDEHDDLDDTSQYEKPVIVPRFSAVFGSVSPKLKRHLKTKFDDITKLQKKHQATVGGNGERVEIGQQITGASTTVKTTRLSRVHSDSQNSAITSQTNGKRHVLCGEEYQDYSTSKQKEHKMGENSGKIQTDDHVPSSNNVSVRDRIHSMNKSLSGGLPTGSVSSPTTSNSHDLLAVGEKVQNQGITSPSSPPCDHRQLTTHPTAASHPPRPSHVGADSRQSSVTSPGSSRKHSIEHVLRGSAVALPCRLYAPPVSALGQDENGANNIITTHARELPFCPSTQSPVFNENRKDAKKEKAAKDEDTIELVSVTSSATTATSITHATSSAIVNNSSSSVSSAPISCVAKPITRVFTHSTEEIDKLVSGEGRLPTHEDLPKPGYSVCSECVNVKNSTGNIEPSGKNRQRNVSEIDTKSVKESSQASGVISDGNIQLQKQLPQYDQGKKEKKYQPVFKDEEQKFVVLRQPISQVIYDMINTSKQQRQQCANSKQEAPQIHQSSPTSPEQERHVEHVVTMVTSQTFEQPCLSLEEKTVRSDSSVSLPSSPVSTFKRADRDIHSEDKETFCRTELKSSGSQTYVLSTAEKGVESDDLMGMGRQMARFETFPPGLKPSDRSDYGGRNITTFNHGSVEGNEFVHNAIALGESQNRAIRKGENESSAAISGDISPPPGPTAMEQLMEEFEEDDEEVNERREKEKSMLKETEMHKFSDRVFKPDLMGNREDEDIDDDVFESDSTHLKSMKIIHPQIKTQQEEDDEDPSDINDEEINADTIDYCHQEESTSNMTSSLSSQGLSRVLRIKSSSSSITTTTSSSEEDDEFGLPDVLPPSLDPRRKHHDSEKSTHVPVKFESAEGAPRRKSGPNYFVFPEFDKDRPNPDLDHDSVSRRRSSGSRDCHSDDDVARGQGIPDYYDDRPLWTRRQKPPGQLSLQMVAIKRRERRERWLRKRRRNMTDLLSTGSSDTGSETSLRHEHPRLRDPRFSLDYDDYEELASYAAEPRQSMGSGILSSPKYSKPILPFLSGGKKDENSKSVPSRHAVRENVIQAKIAAERLEALAPSRICDNDKGRYEERHPWKSRHRDSFDQGSSSDEYENSKRRASGGVSLTSHSTAAATSTSDPSLAIPGIEETFNELMSVKHILEELQDRNPVNEPVRETSAGKFMPLTTENVKSIHEYTGHGRSSRMSITDRTESDLDIYSEAHDDASTDSNMYADDEEDEDCVDTYATADDEFGGGATGGSGSDTLRRRNQRKKLRHGNDNSDDENANFVVSCTFYNSNAQSSVADSGGGVTPIATVTSSPMVGSSGKTTPQNTSCGFVAQASSGPVGGASVLNSDEEFWEGSAAIEAKQLDTASDAVSSTFQNARVQMIDIQQHLQALRRQMEVLEDDMTTSTSVTMTPDMS